MRSKGSSNPKEAGQQAVATYTAEAGPEGGKLRRKYMLTATKSTRSKTSGNSGNAGRKFRCKQRQGGYQTSSYTAAGKFGKK
jgi:hypothetical protein